MIRAPRVSRSVVGFGCLHFFKVPVPKIYDGWERSWSERMFLVPARCCVSLKTIFVCFSFPFFVFKGYVCCLWWDVFWIVSFSLPEVIINSASNMCSYFSWHHLYSRHHFMTCTHTHTHTHTWPCVIYEKKIKNFEKRTLLWNEKRDYSKHKNCEWDILYILI